MAAPFAFTLVLVIDFLSMPQALGLVAGSAAVVMALVWYAQAQIRWLIQDLDIRAIKAAVTFIGSFVIATVATLSVALMVNVDANVFASGGG